MPAFSTETLPKDIVQEANSILLARMDAEEKLGSLIKWPEFPNNDPHSYAFDGKLRVLSACLDQRLQSQLMG